MKIVLFGSGGQVGWQLRRSLATLGDVTALDIDSTDHCGDLLRPRDIAATLRSIAPQLVVNAAGHTAVERAEADAPAAFALNEAACAVLAEETRRLDAWLVHYSTDYVYDGSGDRPWRESDPTGPLSVYGKSKLAGDLAVTSGNPKHLIFRTSWVFDAWGQNFLKSILQAACRREELTVVADQWGAPTRAALVADVTTLAVRQVLGLGSAERPAGVYHLSSAGWTNWHAYACLVVTEALACGLPLRVRPERIRSVSSDEYASKAARPRNSRLDTTHLQQTFGVSLPPWQDGVRSVVAELANQAGFLKGEA